MNLSNIQGFPASNSIFSGFDEFFAPSTVSDFAAVPLLTATDRDSDMVLRRSSPHYEVTENDKQYQLAVDLPGVKLTDIKIDVERDRILCISGGRKVHKTGKDGSVTSSETKFEKRFVLNHSIDASKVTANLQNGVLTIAAPKDVERKAVQSIMITEEAVAENPQDSK